uniref:Uncharacterized protein n=1 Tax=Rhizophora mucronata TaxID=61149 RepID=A0A2P2JJ18_RHIMU
MTLNFDYWRITQSY